MNQNAKNQLIEVICGLVMMIVGVFLFMSKTRVQSGFLGRGEETWATWKVVLVLIPLAVGVIMMIIKPHMRAAKYVALAGAALIGIVIFFDMTIIIEKDIKVIEWILDILLMFGGLAVCLIALFANKKKK